MPEASSFEYGDHLEPLTVDRYDDLTKPVEARAVWSREIASMETPEPLWKRNYRKERELICRYVRRQVAMELARTGGSKRFDRGLTKAIVHRAEFATGGHAQEAVLLREAISLVHAFEVLTGRFAAALSPVESVAEDAPVIIAAELFEASDPVSGEPEPLPSAAIELIALRRHFADGPGDWSRFDAHMPPTPAQFKRTLRQELTARLPGGSKRAEAEKLVDESADAYLKANRPRWTRDVGELFGNDRTRLRRHVCSAVWSEVIWRLFPTSSAQLFDTTNELRSYGVHAGSMLNPDRRPDGALTDLVVALLVVHGDVLLLSELSAVTRVLRFASLDNSSPFAEIASDRIGDIAVAPPSFAHELFGVVGEHGLPSVTQLVEGGEAVTVDGAGSDEGQPELDDTAARTVQDWLDSGEAGLHDVRRYRLADLPIGGAQFGRDTTDEIEAVRNRVAPIFARLRESIERVLQEFSAAGKPWEETAVVLSYIDGEGNWAENRAALFKRLREEFGRFAGHTGDVDAAQVAKDVDPRVAHAMGVLQARLSAERFLLLDDEEYLRHQRGRVHSASMHRLVIPGSRLPKHVAEQLTETERAMLRHDLAGAPLADIALTFRDPKREPGLPLRRAGRGFKWDNSSLAAIWDLRSARRRAIGAVLRGAQPVVPGAATSAAGGTVYRLFLERTPPREALTDDASRFYPGTPRSWSAGARLQVAHSDKRIVLVPMTRAIPLEAKVEGARVAVRDALAELPRPLNKTHSGIWWEFEEEVSLEYVA